LTNVKATSDSSYILLPRLRINENLFRLYNSPRLSLVIDAQYLRPDLEFTAMRCYGQRLVEFNLPLAIDDAAGIEFRYARNGNCG
jgi:hypothetical protein